MTKKHTLVVIGGGTAGLAVIETAAMLGIDVALIEGNRIGGECTWYGCIPSKALLAVAKTAYAARKSSEMGIHAENVTVDFAQVMHYIKDTIQQIYEDESPDKLREQDIAVYEAYAKFKDSHTLELSTGETIHAKKIIIATGAKNNIPSGFEDIPYLTSNTLFDLTDLPEHLIIVGGGPMGVEMAQAFCRLGSKITLITDVERLLPRDEPEASELIQEILCSEGVALHLNNGAVRASGTEGNITITLADGTTLSGSHVLVAIGKHSDVRNLNPDAAGLKHDNGRLLINDTLRTSQKHIFAAGDIVGAPFFTHAALSEGVVALTNAISPFATKRKKHMPWATFTEPEIAHAGMTESQAKAIGKTYDIIHLPISRADRAMTDGKRQGFIKLIHAPNGRLYGATIVGHNAGEMMNEWAQLIERKGRVSELASAIHIYPTMGFSNVIIASVHLRRYLQHSFLGKMARRVVSWLI